MYYTYSILLNDIEKVAQTTFLEDNIFSLLLNIDDIQEIVNSFDLNEYNPFILFILGHKYRLYFYLYKDLKYPKLFLHNFKDIFENIYEVMNEDSIDYYNIIISLLEQLRDLSNESEIGSKTIIEYIIIILDKIFDKEFDNKLIMKMKNKGYRDKILEDIPNMKILNIVDNFKKQLNNLIISTTF